MDSRHDTPRGGLPHSDVHGSKPARGSPWLFAACHVLHRLLVPRHPPNALFMLRSRRRSPEGTSPAMRGNHRPAEVALPRRGCPALGSPSIIALYSSRGVPDRSPSRRGAPTPALRRTRRSRSDIDGTAGGLAEATPRARPGTHQNLIHGIKEQRRNRREPPAEDGGRPLPLGGGGRAARSRDLAATHPGGPPGPRPTPRPPRIVPSGGRLEATGFEPVTPCLQSRCSTS